jgi:hypothetical protein
MRKNLYDNKKRIRKLVLDKFCAHPPSNLLKPSGNFTSCRPVYLSRDQNARQNCIVKKYNISFERMKQFSYLGTTLTNRNSIHIVIKNRMKSGDACYFSVQNLLSSSLLSKNIKIRVYRTITLPVVLHGCETWSLTQREEQRLRVLENRVLRIFGPKGDEATGEWRRLRNEELNDLYS